MRVVENYRQFLVYSYSHLKSIVDFWQYSGASEPILN